MIEERSPVQSSAVYRVRLDVEGGNLVMEESDSSR